MSAVTPLIALTTDFGGGSSYVAQLKGVLLSALPQARIVDVTHDIPPQSIRAAELLLRGAAFAFPIGTTHVVVVDPGVGTGRRPMAVRCRGMTFVGPDNGVLGQCLAQPGAQAVVLDDPSFFRSPVAPTFHGRDIFAPVAAELAAGLSLADVGTPLTDPVPTTLPPPRREASDEGDVLVGEVLGVDRFGNLLTNIPASFGAALDVTFDGGSVEAHRVYGDAPPNRIFALVGSDGYVELAVRDGSAAAHWAENAGASESSVVGRPVRCRLRFGDRS